MHEKQLLKKQEVEYHKKLDDMIIRQDKLDIDKERRLKIENQKKVMLQKAQRDVMLLEAQKRKIIELQS